MKGTKATAKSSGPIKVLRISDFCRTGTGGTPSRSKFERYYKGGTIPWVKSGELREATISKTEERITQAALQETNLRLVPSGALLLAMYGATVGRLGILGVQATTNQAVCHILPDPQKADVRFMFHALSAQAKTLVARGVGGAQPNISQAIVKALKFPLPPLGEQRRIATLLDKANELRAKRRTSYDNLSLLERSLFLEMFGDPARNTRNYPTALLGELGQWSSGGTPPRSKTVYFKGKIPWFSSGELNAMFVRESKEHISREALSETSAKPVKKGSLLLGMYDTAALKAAIADVDCSCNQAIAFAELDEKRVETAYVYFAIVVGREHFRRLQRGVRQKNLNLSMVKEIRIPIPPIEDQRRFCRAINAIGKLREKQGIALQEQDKLFHCLEDRLLG